MCLRDGNRETLPDPLNVGVVGWTGAHRHAFGRHCKGRYGSDSVEREAQGRESADERPHRLRHGRVDKLRLFGDELQAPAERGPREGGSTLSLPFANVQRLHTQSLDVGPGGARV